MRRGLFTSTRGRGSRAQDLTERRGRFRAELTFEQVSPTLFRVAVTVHEAANLVSRDPQAYVRVRLLPDPGNHRVRESQPLPSSANPTFNCRAEYNCQVGGESSFALEDYRLTVEVCSRNSVTADTFLGSSTFKCDDIRSAPFARFARALVPLPCIDGA